MFKVVLVASILVTQSFIDAITLENWIYIPAIVGPSILTSIISEGIVDQLFIETLKRLIVFSYIERDQCIYHSLRFLNIAAVHMIIIGQLMKVIRQLRPWISRRYLRKLIGIFTVIGISFYFKIEPWKIPFMIIGEIFEKDYIVVLDPANLIRSISLNVTIRLVSHIMKLA